MQDHTQGRLVAVVVTYNRLDKLQQTLARLLAARPAHLEAVVVVDNASTDGTGDWLDTQTDPRLDVVSNTVNLGGAGGFEIGMKHAATLFDPDWIVVMDDDAHPGPDTLATFHAHPRDSREGWAAAVRFPDGGICEMNRPWVNPFWHRRIFLRSLVHGRDGFHLDADAYAAKDTTPIDGGSFVGLFFSRRAIELAGYPDHRLFLYGDDVMYTLGLSQAGGRIEFDPDLLFEHDCATLSGEGSVVIRPLWKVYYFYRNQLLVYRRAAGPVFFWPVAALKCALWRLRARHYGAESRDYRKVLSAAVRDGLARRYDRTHDAVKRMVSDGK